MKPKKSRSNYLLYLILTIAFLLLSYHINKPFIGHHDWNGAFWGTVARNYVFYINQAIPFIGIQKEPPYYTQLIYYQNYTPLMPILFTITSLFLGVSELSLRLTTVLFSILMLLYIYKIARLLYSEKVALLATILATVTPMFLYFGKLPDHEPIITSLITITFYYYLKLKTYNKKTYIIFLSFLTLTLLESWSGFIFLATLILFGYFGQKKKLRFFLPPIFLGIFVVLLHLMFLYFFYGQLGVSTFLTSGIGRISVRESVTYVVKYNFLQFLSTEARYFVVYFTRILAIATFLWVIKFLFDLKNKRISQSDKQLLPLGVFAIAFIIIFNNLAFIHDYKLYLLLPFIAIASAQMLWTIFGFLPRSKLTPFLIAIFLVLIVIGVFTERLKFLKTQLDTSFNTPGYELGIYLNKATPPGSKIFVDSRQFHSFYDVFELYYSNRSVTGYDLTLASFKKDIAHSPYKYLVLVDGRTTDPKLQKYLDQNYKANRQKNFTVYNLQKNI